jgi:hypothetical protein
MGEAVDVQRHVAVLHLVPDVLGEVRLLGGAVGTPERKVEVIARLLDIVGDLKWVPP